MQFVALGHHTYPGEGVLGWLRVSRLCTGANCSLESIKLLMEAWSRRANPTHLSQPKLRPAPTCPAIGRQHKLASSLLLL